jgi:hypothetical protein
LKEWVVIHKIKALYDEGNGLKIRAIARQLGISRNTVRKYLRMDEAAIEIRQSHRERRKQLDAYRAVAEGLLRRAAVEPILGTPPRLGLPARGCPLRYVEKPGTQFEARGKGDGKRDCQELRRHLMFFDVLS